MTDDNECEGRGVCGNSGRETFFLRVFVRKTRLELWNEVGDPPESKKQSSRGLPVGECVWVNLERHQIGRIEQNARDMLKKKRVFRQSDHLAWTRDKYQGREDKSLFLALQKTTTTTKFATYIHEAWR